MSLYLKYLRILLKGQLQYRLSFWLLMMSQFLLPLSSFAGIYFLFARFGKLQGWQFSEVVFCFAIIHFVFYFCECFLRGFDEFAPLVVNGEFDRILVRPRSCFMQVLGSQLALAKIGRFIFSAGVLVWAVLNVPVRWGVMKELTLLLMLLSGIAVFTGIFVLAATFCFWSVQGIEAANIFTYGGREIAQYPLGIYQKWVIRFFTFVVPFGCVNYLPLLFVLDKVNGTGIWLMLTPVYGILFLLPCLLVWRYGVKHYRSTGS
jgi:ABC-2 type transport system permease protein